MKTLSNMVMFRSFAEHMGFNWPKDWAMLRNRGPVTWAQVMEERRKRQADRLEQIRFNRSPCVLPAQVWTFRVPNSAVIYIGWHLYVRTFRDEWWVKGAGVDGVALDIMRSFPCDLLPIEENFEEWKERFAASYPRAGIRRGSRQGLAHGWVECDAPGQFPRRFIPRLSPNHLSRPPRRLALRPCTLPMVGRGMTAETWVERGNRILERS